jgi:hypothetical protein
VIAIQKPTKTPSKGRAGFVEKTMKQLLLSLLFSCMMYLGFGQANNPYNQKGIDYVNSLSIISGDVKAGKVKEFNEESIRFYTGKIPLKTQANSELAATIVKTIKTPGFSFTKLLSESDLSSASKQFLNDIYFVKKGTSREQYKILLEQKSAAIQLKDIPVKEKELLLSLCAIAYHQNSMAQGRLLSAGEPSGNCILSGPEGSGPIDCILGGAILGAILGFKLCGWGCALGGAVIGGIVGAFS